MPDIKKTSDVQLDVRRLFLFCHSRAGLPAQAGGNPYPFLLATRVRNNKTSALSSKSVTNNVVCFPKLFAFCAIFIFIGIILKLFHNNILYRTYHTSDWSIIGYFCLSVTRE